MNTPIAANGLAPDFWKKKALAEMSPEEWEALCDGCGKCCLNKLEDEDTQEVALTSVACRLLDDATCRCTHYVNRHQFVPDCIVLKPENLDTHAYWMPLTSGRASPFMIGIHWSAVTLTASIPPGSLYSTIPYLNSIRPLKNGKTI